MKPLHCVFAVSFVLLNSSGLQASDQKSDHKSDRQLNVLMIIVDDLAPVISAYGGPVSTPSIDQLAERGVRFTNNYANVPVCGASRASMLSGLAPTAARFLSYDSRLDQDVEDSLSLPAFFKQHGWHSVANGKVFDVIADSAGGWTEPVWSPGDNWFGKEPDGRGEHLQSAYISPVPVGRQPYFERLAVADSDYPDGQVAAKSVEDLQRLAADDAPFFLAVGFRKPHLPFNAPEQYWQDAGSGDEMLPVTWQSPAEVPSLALHRSPELRGQYDALPHFGDPDDQEAREIVEAYHAAVRFADAQVGRVLEGLKQSSAADNTLVILMGDHGFLLGHQRMWTKHALFESALRTPLIIAGPGVSGGQEVRAVTDLLDVFPTVAELAGLEAPDYLDGASLGPLLARPALTERLDKKGSISRWMNGESVRMQNHRYTRWFDEEDDTVDEMLFDLDADPHEQINLVRDSDAAGVVVELAAYLHDQRSGPGWSEALESSYSLWRLASSTLGGVLLVAMANPFLAGVGVLLLMGGLVLVFVRYRRSPTKAEEGK